LFGSADLRMCSKEHQIVNFSTKSGKTYLRLSLNNGDISALLSQIGSYGCKDFYAIQGGRNSPPGQKKKRPLRWDGHRGLKELISFTLYCARVKSPASGEK